MENLTPYWDVCLDSGVAKFSVSHIVQKKTKTGISWSDGELPDGREPDLLNSIPTNVSPIMSPERTEKTDQDYTAGQTRRYADIIGVAL